MLFGVASVSSLYAKCILHIVLQVELPSHGAPSSTAIAIKVLNAEFH